MTNKELAKQILDYVGKDNVSAVTHCITRLRFTLLDETKVDTEKIKALDGVLGVQNKAGQYQVILGNKVGKVFNDLQEILPPDLTVASAGEGKPADKQNKNWFAKLMETLSSILIPSLPPIIGGGMIKGFLFTFWYFGWIEWGSNGFEILNLISDCMFYFYPFLLAVSAAKRFKTNEYMALALAGALMYPTIINGLGGESAGLSLFGIISLPFIDYSSSVIPIIFSVWILSYVYRFFVQKIPDLLSTIFTPMLTLFIMVPIQLAILAPLGFYAGEYVAAGINWLLQLSPAIAGFIIGATRPFLVFTGTHHAMRVIVQQQISSFGGTTIGAMNYMSVFAQATAPLAVYFVSRSRKMRDLSLSAAVSGYLGVTEPALYSVILKYKIVLIATAVGGGVGGMITSIFGAAEYAMVMSSILTIPATIGEGFVGIVIGIPVTIAVTFLIVFFGRKSIQAQDAQEN